MPSSSKVWGVAAAEMRRAFPCDRFLPDADEAYFRGVTVASDAPTLFRWLCQMRVAPYSYDWIDNFGRRSPRRLTAGLDNLAVGQTVMVIFELVAFAPGRHLTIRLKKRLAALKLFGDAVASYVVAPQADGTCRLLVKLPVRYPKGPHGWLLRRWLPWGDLVMMRRQLLNFKRLAEGGTE